MKEQQQPWDIHAVEPQVLGQIVGHGHAVKQLQTTLESCFADPGRPFPPTLIVGPQGSRSLLARVVARELATPLVEVDGQVAPIACHLYHFLTGIEEGDCLLVDEIDALPPRAQAQLYLALKYRRLGEPFSRDKEPREFPLPCFTALATAKDECPILTPLRLLFPQVVRLQPLGIGDVQRIVEQRAQAMRWHMELEVAKAIVASAGTVPNDALDYLAECHRRSRAAASLIIRAEDVPSWFGGG